MSDNSNGKSPLWITGAIILLIYLLNPWPARAAGAAEDLWKALLEDIAPALVPSDYTFDFSQPIVRGDEDIYQNIEGRAELRFNRKPVPGRKQLASGWEGFQYYVFADAKAAAAFSLTEPEAVENLKNLLGHDKDQNRFDPRARRVVVGVVVASASGPMRLRCIAQDELIGCLSHAAGSSLVVHLMVQEPDLRGARSASERQALVTARATKESGGLLRAALEHGARAELATKRQ